MVVVVAEGGELVLTIMFVYCLFQVKSQADPHYTSDPGTQ